LAITDVVSVSISIEDSSPKAVAFDTPLIVAKAPFVGAREYNATPAGLAEMVTDGFPTYSRAYQMGARMAGQSGGAGSFYVYGRAAQQTHVMDLTVDIAKTRVGQELSFDISYQGVSSTIEVTVATNTVDAILDLVEAEIDASLAGLAGIGVAPDNATATKLTLTADVAGDFFQIDLGGEQAFSLEDVSTAGTGFAAELAAAKVAAGGEAVYGLLIDGYSETEGNLAAAFTEANGMVCLLLSADQEILESGQTDDLASDLEGAGYTRTGVCFTRNMSSDWHAGLLGQMLGQTAGSATWAFKQIAGAEADVLSTTHFNTARDKHALTYASTRGVSHTWDGFAASGRFFDITHGVDFLKADIETRLFQQFLNAAKIPFNATGLSMLEAPIRAALAASETSGLIEPGWRVDMPSLASISSVDKAARILRGVTITATLTGAVHQVIISATLAV
jgi:hypothetical protein